MAKEKNEKNMKGGRNKMIGDAQNKNSNDPNAQEKDQNDAAQEITGKKPEETVKVHVRASVHDVESDTYWSPTIRFVDDNKELRENPVEMPVSIARRCGAFMKDADGNPRQDGSIVLA